MNVEFEHAFYRGWELCSVHIKCISQSTLVTGGSASYYYPVLSVTTHMEKPQAVSCPPVIWLCLLRRDALLRAKQLDGSAPELLPRFAMDASAMDANV